LNIIWILFEYYLNIIWILFEYYLNIIQMNLLGLLLLLIIMIFWK
jgi:hypothetical protein